MGRSSGTRRESEPFRFAVSGERAKLREAALKLGFPIDPQLHRCLGTGPCTGAL